MYQLNNLKKVLVISYFFPPLGGPGVQRSQKFVKYLPKYGWKPYVITVKPIEYVAYDYTLLEEIKFTPIYRTESLDPMRILHFIEKFRKNSQKIYTTTDVKTIKLFREIFPIDSKIGWLPFAYLKAIKIIKERKINRLYATLSPYSSSILAYMISKKTKLPYVLDYRDLWQGKPDISYLTKWHKNISEKWERKVLLNASKIIMNTHRALEKILSIYPDMDKKKFAVINNGYDPEDFNLNIKKEYKSKIIFTYTGSFYGEQTPKYLVSAIKKMKEKIKNRVEFRFIGNFHKEIINLLKSCPDIIKIIPQVPHTESIKYLFNSDYLVLFLAKRKSDMVIPAKLFEYMAVRKPILAMIPTEGETVDIIKRYNLGKIIPTDDIKGIEKAISDMIEKKMVIPEEINTNLFTRNYQAEQLAKILDEI